MKMNVNDIKNLLNEKYSEQIKTLREISVDKNNDKEEYMCDSLEKAFSYDDIVDVLCSNNNNPTTADAIIINKELNFIEFKNGKLKKEKLGLKLKAIEGLYYFVKYVLESCDCEIVNAPKQFILVYNGVKNPSSKPNRSSLPNNQLDEPMDFMKKHLFEKKAEEHYIRFGLERLKGVYYDDIYTLTKEEFENEFLEKIV